MANKGFSKANNRKKRRGWFLTDDGYKKWVTAIEAKFPSHKKNSKQEIYTFLDISDRPYNNLIDEDKKGPADLSTIKKAFKALNIKLNLAKDIAQLNPSQAMQNLSSNRNQTKVISQKSGEEALNWNSLPHLRQEYTSISNQNTSKGHRRYEIAGGIWRIDREKVSPVVKASNGLEYRIFKLQCVDQERVDRGKRYDLTFLSDDRKQRIESQIKRHPRVLQRLERTEGIPLNRTVFKETDGDEDYSYWWVIDEWIDGEFLDALLRQGPLPEKQLKNFAKSLLKIIQALHSVGIILRDLSPKSIIIRSADQQPFVVDFELAKMLTRISSVSRKGLLDNPFRAPEIGEGDEDPTVEADLYSWATVVVSAITGNMRPNDDTLLSCQGLISKALYRQLNNCREALPGDRPESAKSILRALAFLF